MFPLFGHLGEQLGFLPSQGIHQGVTLSHQASFIVQSVFLGKQRAIDEQPPASVVQRKQCELGLCTEEGSMSHGTSTWPDSLQSVHRMLNATGK